MKDANETNIETPNQNLKEHTVKWLDMVRKFARMTDRFLFDGKSYLHRQNNEDQICKLDDMRATVDFGTIIIMNAKSLMSLARRILERDKTIIYSENPEKAKEEKNDYAKNIYRQLKNKVPYLRSYFGIVKKKPYFSTSELALLHILYETEKMIKAEKNTLGKGILKDLLESSFLRFYQNSNPYYEHMLFIKSCLLQKITFKEAYAFEYVRGSIYFGENSFEDNLYECAQYLMSNIDKDAANKLGIIHIENNVRRELCHYTKYLLDGRNKRNKWDNPISDNLSDYENDFIQAYYYFSKLGVEDTLNEPMLPQIQGEYCFSFEKVNTKKTTNIPKFQVQDGVLVPSINSYLGSAIFFEIIPEFSCWEEARKDLAKLRTYIKSNAKIIACLVADKKVDLTENNHEIDKLKENVINHCNNYINLCEFIWYNNIIKDISGGFFLELIYLYERYNSSKTKIRKPGFRDGKAARREISLKTIFGYFNDDSMINYRFDNLPDRKFCDIFYGLISFCKTLESFRRAERYDLISQRIDMKRALYKYFDETIPLLLQHNYPFYSFSDYREDIFPQNLLEIFCNKKISQLQN